MRLGLRKLRLRAGQFCLELDCDLDSARLGIRGPSGAGKTTLLELICGLRNPEGGAILLNDQVLTDREQGILTPPHQRGIGYVPQDLALFPHLSVERNLLYGCQPAGTKPGEFQRITAVFEIEGLLNRSIGGLSGGEKQRVALARAILAGPRLVVLDEPLSSLDAKLKSRVIGCLQTAQKEFSLPTICVTHQQDEEEALCDLVLTLEGGRLASQTGLRRPI